MPRVLENSDRHPASVPFVDGRGAGATGGAVALARCAYMVTPTRAREGDHRSKPPQMPGGAHRRSRSRSALWRIVMSF